MRKLADQAPPPLCSAPYTIFQHYKIIFLVGERGGRREGKEASELGIGGTS